MLRGKGDLSPQTSVQIPLSESHLTSEKKTKKHFLFLVYINLFFAFVFDKPCK